MFANCRTEASLLPQGAKEVRSKGGGTIPMVFVTTADGSKGLDAVPYTMLKEEMRDAVRDLDKALETMDVVGSGASEEPVSPGMAEAEKAITLFAEEQEWKNSDGKAIIAAIKSVSGDEIVFLMGGREVPYSLSKLSQESREKIAALGVE